MTEKINLNGEGLPRVATAIRETLPTSGQTVPVRVGVLGITQMGAPFQVVPIDSWRQFVAEFGGLHPDSSFPLLCKRALEAGGLLYVARVAHDNAGSWEGTKASATVTEGANNCIFYARQVGAGYNGISLRIKTAKSRDSSKVDVEETYNGETNTVYNINLNAPGAEDITKLANGLRYVEVYSLPAVMPLGSATLAGGAQTVGAIVDADYVGSPTSVAKGLHAFDETFDFGRIANFERNNPTVDAGFIAYCELRQDLRAMLCVPDTDADASEDIVDYRKGTGIYSHAAFDSLYADMFVGKLFIADATAVGGKTAISCIGDVAGLTSAKDRTAGFASSVSGATRGVIPNNLGVIYNLEGATNREDANFVYDNGLNPVVRKALPNANGISVMQTVVWGNRSLVLEQASGFRYSNVCDLMVLLRRRIFPILNTFVFEPNLPASWFKIYARVKPIIEELVAANFIQAGEGNGWIWNGDQHAKSIQKAVLNTPSDVANGIYRAELLVRPVNLMEYIGFTLIRTDEGTSLQINQ